MPAGVAEPWVANWKLAGESPRTFSSNLIVQEIGPLGTGGGFDGGMVLIDTSVAGVVVRPREPVTPCNVALAVNDPAPMPLAKPEELTRPIEPFDVPHCTDPVRFWVEPSL